MNNVDRRGREQQAGRPRRWPWLDHGAIMPGRLEWSKSETGSMNGCDECGDGPALKWRRRGKPWCAVAFCQLALVCVAACDGSPTTPGGGSVFTSVELGEDHTCGVNASAVALCWGMNNRGQLGDGSNTGRTRPVVVAGGLAFNSLSPGISHTCGIATTGVAYCWGRNAEGQLGDDTRVERNAPIDVSGDLMFTALSTGGLHTCGLTGGVAYCWGSGAQGQLGVGSSGTGFVRGVPTPVSGGLSFVTLDAGGLHGCGITGDGTVYCWGSDSAGALGTAEDENCDDGLGNPFPCSAAPVPVSSAHAFASVSAGVAHTCAVTNEGAAYCWGRNVEGQLGDGSTASSSVPVLVLGDLQFVAVSAGNFHSCGLTASGAAYCWGGNHRGQLGDGSDSGSSNPTLVSGGLSFSSVCAGGAHTCGLTDDGAVYCWGVNTYGQLGVETTPDTCINVPCSLAPVRVRM